MSCEYTQFELTACNSHFVSQLKKVTSWLIILNISKIENYKSTLLLISRKEMQRWRLTFAPNIVAFGRSDSNIDLYLILIIYIYIYICIYIYTR